MKKTIIIALVLAIVFSFTACQNANNQKNEQLDGNGKATHDEKDDLESEGISYKIKYFYQQKLIKEQNVKKGEASIPPKGFLEYNYVFTGWSNDISHIDKDISVYASSEYIGDKNNVLYIATEYTNQNDIELVLSLGGIVNIDIVTLKIEYTSEVAFGGFGSSDEDTIYNHIEDEKAIYLNYMSLNGTNGSLDLCAFSFKKVADAKSADLKITVITIACYDEQAMDFIDADYNIIDGKIYFI